MARDPTRENPPRAGALFDFSSCEASGRSRNEGLPSLPKGILSSWGEEHVVEKVFGRKTFRDGEDDESELEGNANVPGYRPYRTMAKGE